MKVIDLLNKIAKGEELPRIIRYASSDYNLNTSAGYKGRTDIDYKNCSNDNLFELGNMWNNLNEEVEIIEEPKKIDKIFRYGGILNATDDETKIKGIICEHNKLVDKINELIDEVNKLKGD